MRVRWHGGTLKNIFKYRGAATLRGLRPVPWKLPRGARLRRDVFFLSAAEKNSRTRRGEHVPWLAFFYRGPCKNEREDTRTRKVEGQTGGEGAGV